MPRKTTRVPLGGRRRSSCISSSILSTEAVTGGCLHQLPERSNSRNTARFAIIASGNALLNFAQIGIGGSAFLLNDTIEDSNAWELGGSLGRPGGGAVDSGHGGVAVRRSSPGRGGAGARVPVRRHGGGGRAGVRADRGPGPVRARVREEALRHESGCARTSASCLARCPRMRSTTSALVITATMRISSPHAGQRSGSTSRILRRSRAQDLRRALAKAKSMSPGGGGGCPHTPLLPLRLRRVRARDSSRASGAPFLLGSRRLRPHPPQEPELSHAPADWIVSCAGARHAAAKNLPSRPSPGGEWEVIRNHPAR